MKPPAIPENISSKLKNTPEQKLVVGPLIAQLVSSGWHLDQIVFGKQEWRVPSSPSEATKREKKQSFNGYPVDIAVFDQVANLSNPRHLLFIIECKQPAEKAGVSQLEAYFVAEPHVQLGVWANDYDPSPHFSQRVCPRRFLMAVRLRDVPRRSGAAPGPSLRRGSAHAA